MLITLEGGILKSHDKKWNEEIPVLKFIWRKSPRKYLIVINYLSVINKFETAPYIFINFYLK